MTKSLCRLGFCLSTTLDFPIRNMTSHVILCQMLVAPDHVLVQVSISGLLREEVADIVVLRTFFQEHLLVTN